VADHEFLESLISLCPDGIIAVDNEGTIVVFNQAAEKLTGYARTEVLGKVNITQVYQPPELARAIKKKIYSPEFGGPGRLDGLEVEIISRNGRKVPIRLSGTLLHLNGEEMGSVGFFHDLTRQKLLEDRLRQLSITDSLTGLYNRRHFYSILHIEATRAQRYQRALSLACFDLDNFKPFNDTYGHLEGDQILRFVGQTVHSVLRGVDHAYRYGGDEFVMLFPETKLDEAAKAAERLRHSFNERWPSQAPKPNRELRPVTLSLGVAELVPGEGAENLVKRADLAMYEAKRAGGDSTLKAGAKISRPD
jgi:diguanylate cyclase (GGDEF)-like protein/PAS domain S-box-containing protein